MHIHKRLLPLRKKINWLCEAIWMDTTKRQFTIYCIWFTDETFICILLSLNSSVWRASIDFASKILTWSKHHQSLINGTHGSQRKDERSRSNLFRAVNNTKWISLNSWNRFRKVGIACVNLFICHWGCIIYETAGPIKRCESRKICFDIGYFPKNEFIFVYILLLS